MTQLSFSSKKIETYTLESEVFFNTKKLYIYTFDKNEIKEKDAIVKILLMQDGDQLFSLTHKYLEEENWNIDCKIEEYFEKPQLRNLVIVGIESDYDNRAREFLPWENIYHEPPEPNPIGRNYPRFVIDEVMPLVIDILGIPSGNIEWGIGGASYGALISLYSALKVPVFDFILLQSPSLYVANQEIIRVTEDYFENIPDHIYIGVGTNENGNGNCHEYDEENELMLMDVKSLVKLILIKRPEITLTLVTEKCGKHNNKYWGDRFITALSTWIG